MMTLNDNVNNIYSDKLSTYLSWNCVSCKGDVCTCAITKDVDGLLVT